MTSTAWSPVKSITEAKSSSRPLRARRSSLGKSLNICTTYADCCTLAVVHRYGGAIFVVQTILWCGISGVYGVYLVKSGVYLTIPFFKRGRFLFRIHSRHNNVRTFAGSQTVSKTTRQLCLNVSPDRVKKDEDELT